MVQEEEIVFQGEVEPNPSEENPYLGLRRKVLGLKRQDFVAYMREHAVHAVLIDTNMDGIIYSVALVVDGTISLYYQTGGGVLGMGQKFPDLAMATRAFVYSADQVISKLPVAKDTNLPEIGERTFYIIAEDKVYKAVSHKSQMADEPYEIQILNYLSEKIMAQFISLYEAKDISKTD